MQMVAHTNWQRLTVNEFTLTSAGMEKKTCEDVAEQIRAHTAFIPKVETLLPQVAQSVQTMAKTI